MPRLPHLHLHRILIDDQALPLVINARSQAAVRDHFIEHHIRIERLTPEEAFQAGVHGAVIETVGANEPNALAETPNTPADTSMQADEAPRPIEGPGPGYVAALNEAASL